MELEFHEWLRENLAPHPALLLGPGDDAAVLKLAQGERCVVTSDLLCQGVHFRLSETTLERVGRKALAVNLSDLAAMAAKPLAAVISILLPRQDGLQIAKRLYEGLLPLAERYEMAIAGGDTNCWDGELVINVTAIGQLTRHGPLLRSGAQVGDALLVTGSFGGSILGHHFDFEPRVHEAICLQTHYDLHAGMDVTDGLLLDLWRLTKASGVGAELWPAAVPVSPAASSICGAPDFTAPDAAALEMRESALTPLTRALTDGEDFELLFTTGPAEAARLLTEQPLDIPISQIGEVVAEPGIWRRTDTGRRARLPVRGYVHGEQQ